MKKEHTWGLIGLALGLYLAVNSASGAKAAATIGGVLPKLPV